MKSAEKVKETKVPPFQDKTCIYSSVNFCFIIQCILFLKCLPTTAFASRRIHLPVMVLLNFYKRKNSKDLLRPPVKIVHLNQKKKKSKVTQVISNPCVDYPVYPLLYYNCPLNHVHERARHRYILPP